jgi:hypothetical protein
MAHTHAPAGQIDLRKAVAERRSGEDRRKVNLGPPPPERERRKGERRSGRDRRKNQ